VEQIHVFNLAVCCFLYNAKDLSAPLVFVNICTRETEVYINTRRPQILISYGNTKINIRVNTSEETPPETSGTISYLYSWICKAALYTSGYSA
jgi:hypothetical protein